MKNDAVGLRSRFRNRFGLLWRPIEHLHAPAGNFQRVIMVVLVPKVEPDIRPCHRLGDHVLDLHRQGLGIGGLVNQALQASGETTLQ